MAIAIASIRFILAGSCASDWMIMNQLQMYESSTLKIKLLSFMFAICRNGLIARRVRLCPSLVVRSLLLLFAAPSSLAHRSSC